MIHISAKTFLAGIMSLLLLLGCRLSSTPVAYEWSSAKETWGHHVFNEIVVSVPAGLPYIQYRTNYIKFAIEGHLSSRGHLVPGDSLALTIPIDPKAMSKLLRERPGYGVWSFESGIWAYERVASFEITENQQALVPETVVNSTEIGIIRQLPNGSAIQIGLLYTGHDPVFFRDWDPEKIFSEEEYWLVKEIAMSAKD